MDVLQSLQDYRVHIAFCSFILRTFWLMPACFIYLNCFAASVGCCANVDELVRDSWSHLSYSTSICLVTISVYIPMNNNNNNHHHCHPISIAPCSRNFRTVFFTVTVYFCFCISMQSAQTSISCLIPYYLWPASRSKTRAVKSWHWRC